MPKTTVIGIQIERKGAIEFSGTTMLAELKRAPKQLVEFLFRDNSFPYGVFLMTERASCQGMIFTLAHGDLIRISIDGIGVLENTVAPDASL